MKAIVYSDYGLPEVLRLEEVPVPIPREDEVLIKVHAASVNSWDWDLVRGTPFFNRLGGLRKPKHPILGADIAGRVEAVGEKVALFKSGDEVFGDLSHGGWGGFAEYVCARESELVLKSAGMSFEEAAAIPQAAVLALQGLRCGGKIERGQKVLFNGAGGGVGTFGLQIAKSFGAEVTGVDSAEKLDLLRRLGADHVVDYSEHDFVRDGGGYDLVLDVVASRSVFDCRRALNPEGTYVVVGGAMATIAQTFFLGLWFSMVDNKAIRLLIHRPNRNDLEHLKELCATGEVVPVIDRCFPLSEVGRAVQYLGEGRVQGKVIINVSTE